MRFALIFITAFFISTHAAQANTLDFFSHFIEQLESQNYPINYITQAAQEMSEVELYDSSSVANLNYGPHYSLFWNALYLPNYWATPTNHLKSIEDLGADDIGQLFHELWHAYFHRIAKHNRRFFRWFETRAETLYSDYSYAVGMECLEEAFSRFICGVIRHFTYLEREYPAHSREERDRSREGGRVQSLQEVIEENYSGYYTSWGRSVFIPGIYIQPSDKEWILEHLFENKIRY